MPSKAKKVHFQKPNNIGPVCGTRHGNKITLTDNRNLVSCKLCRFHLGLYVPKDHTGPTVPGSVGRQLDLLTLDDLGSFRAPIKLIDINVRAVVRMARE